MERKIDGARQGGRAATAKALRGRIAKLERDFEETRRTDFFASAAGRDLGSRLERVHSAVSELAGAAAAGAAFCRASLRGP